VYQLHDFLKQISKSMGETDEQITQLIAAIDNIEI
jgi:hypothetical protein